MSKLTVLSFGGGQDSTAILYKLIYDDDFLLKYAPEDLIVVMADTGNEHEDTDIHVKEVVELCKNNSIPFYFLHCGSELYNGEWRGGLINFYEAGNRIGSKAYPKTCTHKLKIDPIYKFIDAYVFSQYFSVREHVYENCSTARGMKILNAVKEGIGFKALKKSGIKSFNEVYGKIDVILGIAAGEEKRAGSNEESTSVWARECINKVYPLIDLGMDRQACQDYIKSTGHTVPPPSNCIVCPFLSEQELLYMYRFNKPWYDKFVQLERNKIEARAHNGDLTKTLSVKGVVSDNFGVWGKKLLPEKLEEAKIKYGHMTDEDLIEYKMSHGHCVQSKY